MMKLQDFCYNVTNLMELMKTDMNVPKAFICILFCLCMSSIPILKILTL